MSLHCADRTYVRCRNLTRQLCYHCRNDMHRPTLGPDLETLDHKNKCESASYCKLIQLILYASISCMQAMPDNGNMLLHNR